MDLGDLALSTVHRKDEKRQLDQNINRWIANPRAIILNWVAEVHEKFTDEDMHKN